MLSNSARPVIREVADARSERERLLGGIGSRGDATDAAEPMTTRKDPAFDAIERAFHGPLENPTSGWTAVRLQRYAREAQGDSRRGPAGFPDGWLGVDSPGIDC